MAKKRVFRKKAVKKAKVLPLKLIHHEHKEDFDAFESRLMHLSDLLETCVCDEQCYIHKVQEKVNEALYWYGEYLLSLEMEE